MKFQDARIVRVLTNSTNLVAVTFFLYGFLVNTDAKRMDEAACHPRPVPVAVTDNHEVLPYHVLLHRCSGTCENTSPRVKSCAVKESVEIELEVTAQNQKKSVTVHNHTSCHCKCVCKPNEMPVDSFSRNCQCFKSPAVSSGQRKDDQQKQPTPYLIAIVGVGTFALIVLLFDSILYFKKTGFFYTLKKHACCNGSKSEIDGKTMPEQQANSSCDSPSILTKSSHDGDCMTVTPV